MRRCHPHRNGRRSDMAARQSKQNEYRLVRYYYQWPMGDKKIVISEHLTEEEAQELKRRESLGLISEDLVIEKMES